MAEFYDLFKEEVGDELEIVFVSSDNDESSFSEYYGTMPWAALPFSESSVKEALSEKFGISGIPALIVLNGATGEVIDRAGRSTVTSAKGVVKKAADVWHIS